MRMTSFEFPEEIYKMEKELREFLQIRTRVALVEHLIKREYKLMLKVKDNDRNKK